VSSRSASSRSASSRRTDTRSVIAPETRHLRVLLAVGFLALAAAVFFAQQSPAFDFEHSIYAGTPVEFWVGAGVAALAAIVVATASTSEGSVRRIAAFLVGLAALAVVSLPLFRSYYFYGGGDALSHLGWTRMLGDGRLDPVNFLYPGIHSLSLFVSQFTGLPVRTSILVIVLPVFTGLFLLFTALVVRALVDDPEVGVLFGALSAVLFLPINNISVHAKAHPASQAILFSAFCYYVLFRYLTSDRSDWLRPTAIGALLALSTLAILVIHPQQSLNFVVVLGVVATLQFLARRLDLDHAIATQRRVYAQAIFGAVAFFLWVPDNERFSDALFGTLNSLFAAGATGATVAQRSGSLTTIGTSIEELFLKLFLVTAVYCAIAAVLMLAASTDRLRDTPSRKAMIAYLTAGFVPVLGVFFLTFFASVGDMYFRYLGYIMVIVTILGAVTLAKVTVRMGDRFGGGATRAIVVALFLVLVPLAAATVHPSPYMYQGSGHVNEQTMDGYATTFELRDPGVEFAGVRGGPRRMVDAHYGTTSETVFSFPGYEAQVPFAVFGNNVTEYYETRRYVPVTAADRVREVQLYEGFRYSQAGFDSLETTPGIHRVQSNDGYQLYLVGGEENETSTAARTEVNAAGTGEQR
jgi:uncharacterized membrane protein